MNGGNIVGSPEEIVGGLLHKLYKVKTNKGEFAVKILNPAIMKRENVLKNMIFSEKISGLFQDEIPVVSALENDGTKVHLVGEQYFMIFNWVDAKSVYPPNIDIRHCREIGTILGKMHALNINIPELEKDEISNKSVDWNIYLDSAKEQRALWVDKYEHVVENLICWSKSVLDAKTLLSSEMVISHRDLDPKNVLWQGYNPYVIDWEVAGYVNPYQELLEVLNYWSDDGNGGLNRDNFNAVICEYKKHMCLDNVNWEAVLASGYDGMLGWLEYNIKRALGIEASNEDERKLGEQQVFGTINELKRYNLKIGMIISWLRVDMKSYQ